MCSQWTHSNSHSQCTSVRVVSMETLIHNNPKNVCMVTNATHGSKTECASLSLIIYACMCVRVLS